jgi:peptidyl-prolyl cis-trans isomerase C
VTRVLLCALLAATLLAGACRKPAAASTAKSGKAAATTPAKPEPLKPVPVQLPDVLARVNGEPVKKADFDRFIKNMELNGGPIPPFRRDEVYRGALDQLVTLSVLSQEAKARNLNASDAEVDSSVNQMRAQAGEERFQQALAARNLTIEQLRSDTGVELRVNKLVQAEISKIPGPSDAEVKEFFDKNPEKFEQVRASHILVAVPQQADDATVQKARAKAENLLKQARSGKDFADLARKNSDDGSKTKGGDLDYFARGTMVPQFSEAAFAMKPGEISDIVQTQFGFHIIKVTDRRAPKPEMLAQVGGQIRDYLFQQKKDEHARQFIDELKKKAKIEVLI